MSHRIGGKILSTQDPTKGDKKQIVLDKIKIGKCLLLILVSEKTA